MKEDTINISNRVLITNNIILEKNYSKYYELPNEFIFQIKKYIKTNNISAINNELYMFLSKENLFSKGKKYDPFIEKGKYNNYRLLVQLTGNCNLFCKHCYLGGSSNEKNNFTYQKVIALIEEAIKLGIYRIDFTGGEILTIDYLVELLEYLEYRPISYSLFTNLAFLSKEKLNMLKSLKGIKEIITSLDYFKAELHDEFRGKKGSFNSTRRAIKELNRAGIPITINTMILQNNKEDIERMIDYYKNYGIMIQLDTVTLKGNAELNLEYFKTDILKDIKFIINCMKKINCDITINDLIGEGCGVGKNLLYIDKNEEFQLCPGLTKKENNKYYLGKTLLEAIQKMNKTQLVCNLKNCKHYDNCSFGCREKALVQNGKDDSPDYMMCKLFELFERG